MDMRKGWRDLRFFNLFGVKLVSMIVMHFILTGLENFVLGMCCFWVGRLG